MKILLGPICLIFILIETTGCSNVTRSRRQACGFRCAQSGVCIDAEQECNGKVDCEDSSDETSACKRFNCPGFAFRCKYGACVDGDFECNKRTDCRDNSDETSPNCKTKPNICSDEEFQCTSGDCIPVENMCDGKPQCQDNSDETSEACSSVRCQSFSFRCKYGACVDGASRCNGTKECFDGSDEDPKMCGTTIPIQTPKPVTETPFQPVTPVEGGCVLPQHPTNGKWNVKTNLPMQFKPGDTVGPFTTVEVHCHKGYRLDGNLLTICQFGQWSSRIGVCQQTCPPYKNTPLINFTCKLNGYEVDCTQAISDTIATFKCTDYYEEEARENAIKTRICRNGSWNREKPNCVPVCGQKSPPAETLIVEGNVAAKGDYPWHVGLYKLSDTRKIYLCGGSLISLKVILTAAHCVTERKYGEVYPASDYVVAVGKHYRNYSDPGDPDAQFSRVTKIYVYTDYRGETRNYQGDIALLVTQNKFTLSRRVQPVCLDRNGKVERIVTRDPLTNGTVIGWGFTQQDGAPSDELKEIDVPYIPLGNCENSLPDGFRSYLTADKICAGFWQKHTGVCKGDSGGGLVFKHYDDRYYVLGVVSLAPPTKDGHCDTQYYGLYTRVFSYNEFIDLIESKNRV